MDKIPENKKSCKKDYYNEPVNKWLREYLKHLNKDGYGNKIKSDKEFAKKCGIEYKRLINLSGGNARVNTSEIINISKASGVSADEILGLEPVPDNLKIDGLNIFSKECLDKLKIHISRKDKLFSSRDEYLKFLEYLIMEDDFIKAISEKASESLNKLKEDIENNKLSNEELNLLANYKDYDDLQNRIKSNDKLNDRFKKIITDKKVRNAVRDIITKYIADNLK